MKYIEQTNKENSVKPARTKDATHDINPERKELNGKVPTSAQ